MLRLPLFVPLTVLGLLEPKLVGALPGPGKADSQLAVFFFLALVLSLGLLWTLSRLKQNLFQPPLERVFLSLEKGEPGCYVRLCIR